MDRHSEIKAFPLTQGFATVVDLEDFHMFGKHKWFAKFGAGKVPYAARSVRENGKTRTVRLHRVIMNSPQGMEVDHENGDTLDNRRSNLKIVTKQKNLENRAYGQ